MFFYTQGVAAAHPASETAYAERVGSGAQRLEI